MKLVIYTLYLFLINLNKHYEAFNPNHPTAGEPFAVRTF